MQHCTHAHTRSLFLHDQTHFISILPYSPEMPSDDVKSMSLDHRSKNYYDSLVQSSSFCVQHLIVSSLRVMSSYTRKVWRGPVQMQTKK